MSLLDSSDRFRISPPLRGFDRIASIPGSKSFSVRATLLASLARAPVKIEGVSRCQDVLDLEQALSVLSSGDGGEIDCGEGAAPARFLMAAAALTRGTWHLTGRGRLPERPMADLTVALRGLGATIDADSLPTRIVGGGLAARPVEIDGRTSSQFASALLLIAPFLDASLDLTVRHPISSPYLDVTADALARFGVDVETTASNDQRSFHVTPGVRPPAVVSVPPDASGAGYFHALGALSSDGLVVPRDSRSPQPDDAFLECLEDMGATLDFSENAVRVSGPLVRGGRFDVGFFPDSMPILAAVGAFVSGTVFIEGAPHLAFKESDRIDAMARGLARLDVPVEPRPDGLVVGTIEQADRDVVIDARGDHRIAMAFAVIGARRPIVIEGARVVTKSFPSFFDELARFLTVEPV